jgi:AcrR family transcriptional regulator
MNHMTHTPPTGVAIRNPGQRHAARIATRHRLIASARARFLDLGYDATTLRDIAADADRSIGSVFNCFSDKLELLEAVLAEEALSLGEAARAEVTNGKDFVDTIHRLHDLMMETPCARLVLIDRHIPAQRRKVQTALREVLMEAAIEARDRGEIAPHVRLDLVCGLIWDLLTARCQDVIEDEANPTAAVSITCGQVDLLMTAIAP